MPDQKGFWSDHLRHLCKGFPAQPLSYLGRSDALIVGEAGPTFELILANQGRGPLMADEALRRQNASHGL